MTANGTNGNGNGFLRCPQKKSAQGASKGLVAGAAGFIVLQWGQALTPEQGAALLAFVSGLMAVVGSWRRDRVAALPPVKKGSFKDLWRRVSSLI